MFPTIHLAVVLRQDRTASGAGVESGGPLRRIRSGVGLKMAPGLPWWRSG